MAACLFIPLNHLYQDLEVVFLLKSIHTTPGTHMLLFAGEKGMACGADIHAQVFLCRAGFKGIPASAGHHSPFVLRMNSRFHETSPLFTSGSIHRLSDVKPLRNYITDNPHLQEEGGGHPIFSQNQLDYRSLSDKQ
jgi:hypothetical protein